MLRKLANQGDWLITMLIGATLAACSGLMLVSRAAAPAPAASAWRRVIPGRRVFMLCPSRTGLRLLGRRFLCRYRRCSTVARHCHAHKQLFQPDAASRAALQIRRVGKAL